MSNKTLLYIIWYDKQKYVVSIVFYNITLKVRDPAGFGIAIHTATN